LNKLDERRTHPRISTRLDMQATHEDGGVVARLVARNLSLGGLYCTSNTDFPEMTRLEVRLMLPLDRTNGNPQPLDLEAVVVRRESLGDSAHDEPRYKLGLFFTNLDDDSKERIARYLNGRESVSVH